MTSDQGDMNGTAMFDSLILMAQTDFIPFFSEFLLSQARSIQIVPVDSRDALLALPAATLRRSRLIAFASPIIVPGDILAEIGFGAYNFHPGPPSYPGLAPASYAIYQGARFYGATAHVMIEKVDAGPIIGLEMCVIPEGATVAEIELMAFKLLLQMLQTMSHHLANDPSPLPTLPVTWSPVKSSRRMLEQDCDIPITIAAEELHRRVRAFANTHFGVPLTVNLHGYRFRLEVETSSKVASAPENNATRPFETVSGTSQRGSIRTG